MSLYKKYELGDVIRDDGVKSFQARDLTSGRQVQVHLVMGIPGRLPPPYELLDQLKKLPESHRAHVIETGEQSGTPYVVTLPLEGFSGFRDWLTEKAGTLRTAVPPKENRESSPLSRVGRWKIPALSDAAPPPPAPPPAADRTLSLATPPPAHSPASQNPNLETTRIFTPAFPSAAPHAQAPEPPPQPVAPLAPPPVPVPQPEASEFTHAFLTPTLPAPPPAQGSPSAGEFTMAFGGPSTTPSHQPPPSPSPAPSEFTQAFFQPAVPAAPQPEPSGITSQFGVPKAAQPPPKEPSEFTQAFSAFPAAQPEPSGITSQFGAPKSAPQPLQPNEPSEFTQAFSTFSPSAPIASQPEPTGVTSQFGVPKFAPQPPTKDPSEFSQLFSSPLAQKQPPPQASPLGEQTRLFESPASSSESTLRMHPSAKPDPQGLGLPKAPPPGFGSNLPQPQSSHGAPPPVSPEFASAPSPVPGASPLMATRNFEALPGPGRSTSQPASDDEYARRFGAPPAEPLTGNVPAPAPPAPKKKPMWPLIALGVLIVLILIGLIITLLK